MTNLKRIIDEKGISQKWLAEQIGVTEVSMSRYISGERIPKAPIAIRMADVLGVDVKELYGWDDEHVVGESEQPETHEERTETHACDLISRQAAIRWVKTECNPYGKPTLDFESGKKVIEHLEKMPSAQPDYQEVLGWLLAYHTMSFDLHGHYLPHEVISWLINDFTKGFIAERKTE